MKVAPGKMRIKRLAWDSAFFGIPVGSVELPSGDVSVADVGEMLSRSKFKLTYVFLPLSADGEMDNESLKSVLAGLGGLKVDTKITYWKSLVRVPTQPVSDVVSATRIVPNMETLACSSGWCSRFKVDKQLSRFLEPMYKVWLKRDFERGKVFVCPSCDMPYGLVTASVCEKSGRLGLVAVDEGHRREGLGKKLITQAESWLARNGSTSCEVVTQAANIGGVQFYEKMGFVVKSRVEVWHIWSKTRL